MAEPYGSVYGHQWPRANSQVAHERGPNGTQNRAMWLSKKYPLDYQKSSHMPLDSPPPSHQDRVAAYR